MIADFPSPGSRNGGSPVSFATPIDNSMTLNDHGTSKDKARNGHPNGHHSSSIQNPLDGTGSVQTNSFGMPRRRGARRGAVSRSVPNIQAAMGAGGQQQAKSADAAKRQQTKQLPRSVRWRLSLGLLTRPTTDGGGVGEREKLLRGIEDLNALKLRCQRSRYDELEKRHYWRSTPVSIADESSGDGVGADAGGGTHLEGMHHVAPGDDPLSSALLLDKGGGKNNSNPEGEKDKRLFGGSIFGGGTKGRQERRGSRRLGGGGGLNDSNHSVHASFTSVASSTNGSDGGGGGDEAACKGSRWADFYSTREVLDVIEKDLVRLPANHYTIYHEWRIKNIEWKEDREKEEEWNREQLQKDITVDDEETVQSLSDGTVQMQHQPLGQPLNHHKSWKLGQSLNFGLLKGAKSVENMTTLLGADEEGDEEQKRDENARAEVQNSIKERAGRISQILFVYAREHPEIGYRQGMHEVLSYILLALEMDLLEQAISVERNSWRNSSSTSFGLTKSKNSRTAHGGMAGVDSSGNLVVVRLLDQNYILHDTFILFEYIMTSLAPAYDAIPLGDEMAQSMLEEAKTERGETPMESMTSSIVSKIRFVARDEQLFGHVLYMPVPPQLYFAKWIRLMFGRELAGGMKNVLRMWDAFFELASARVSSQEEVPTTVALLDVLKTAAASMILLIRNKLLAPTMAADGTMTGEPDPNIGIGYLMNYPPVEDIGSLVEMISKLLKREQKLSNQYKVRKEREQSFSYLSSQSQMISSIDEHPLEMNERANESWSANPPAPAATVDNPLTSHLKQDTGNGQQSNIFLHNVDGDCAYDRSQGQPPQQLNISQSLGTIAGGLFDFGSKTASAAIASIQNKYEVALDHPLQQFNDAATLNDRGGDFIIKYRPVSTSTTKQNKTAQVVQLPIGEKLQLPIGENISEHDLVDRLFDTEGQEGSDDTASNDDGLDESIASKLSFSRSVGDSLQKSPKELAFMLERSVATLMSHFNEKLSSEADLAEESGEGPNNIGNSQHSSPIIPNEIWDAMAEIDRVRKELLQQDALTSMDHSRSCSSLRSSVNSGNSKRRHVRRQS